jgi:Tol biopolymer transport system component/DNA-binding winged helix-turn-helix (wHTH) protein
MNREAAGLILRFGAFELDLGSREVRKSGVLRKLRPQAFRVLVLLASRSGQVVTREEIQKEIWHDGSVVDFEQGVNFCIRQVRTVLGDNAESPRFIETIARRGYRFLVPVDSNQAVPLALVPTQRLTPVRPFAAAVVLAVGAAGLIWNLAPVRVATLPLPHPIPVTTYPGWERDPALSPDGNHVAFTWDGEAKDNSDVYTKALDGGPPLRLTSNPAEERHPAWSPDGRRIAFLRRVDNERSKLLLLPANSGPERTLGEVACGLRSALCSVAWSPDGRWLAVPDHESAAAPYGLVLVSPETAQKRSLTQPSDGQGDFAPAFSPDGRMIAFARRLGFAETEVHLLPLTADLHAAGASRRLTGRGWATSPMWTLDGRHVLYWFSEGHETPSELRSIAVSGSPAASSLILAEDGTTGLAVGRHLVFGRRHYDANIWRAEIRPPGAPLAKPYRLISSTRADTLAHYSPDGSRIAFSSTRSGAWEIWLAEADGSNAVRLTFFGGPHIALMGWSPDGRRLAFHGFRSLPETRFDLFTIPAAGGAPTRVTPDSSDGHTPTYSRDGRWLYFSSRRSGQLELWKMPVRDGDRAGDAIQISRGNAGSQVVESPDGKVLYYCHASLEQGIWRVPVDGGTARQVTGPSAAEGCGLAVTDEGLFYIAAPDANKRRSIQFLRFSDQTSRPIVLTDRPLGMSLSVSSDGRFILYTQVDSAGSDLMMIHNFRAR